MTEILDLAAEVFQVTRDELVGSSRVKQVAHARQAVAWALRCNHPTLSYERIGAILGERNHTTIIWALSAAERRAKADPDYALRLVALLNR